MKKNKIFIVEDDNLLALHLKMLLKALDYEVIGQASTGEEVIQFIQNNPPDLILMDISLKGE
jgi:two-component system, response regulator PdtaR